MGTLTGMIEISIIGILTSVTKKQSLSQLAIVFRHAEISQIPQHFFDYWAIYVTIVFRTLRLGFDCQVLVIGVIY